MHNGFKTVASTLLLFCSTAVARKKCSILVVFWVFLGAHDLLGAHSQNSFAQKHPSASTKSHLFLASNSPDVPWKEDFLQWEYACNRLFTPALPPLSIWFYPPLAPSLSIPPSLMDLMASSILHSNIQPLLLQPCTPSASCLCVCARAGRCCMCVALFCVFVNDSCSASVFVLQESCVL